VSLKQRERCLRCRLSLLCQGGALEDRASMCEEHHSNILVFHPDADARTPYHWEESGHFKQFFRGAFCTCDIADLCPKARVLKLKAGTSGPI